RTQGDCMRQLVFILAFVIGGLWPALAGAQAPAGARAGAPAETSVAQAPAAPPDDPDLDVDPLQPDFTLVNLPTTLRLPRHRAAFRVTPRIARPLGEGDFGALASDFFGLDTGAQIGLEFRYGLMRGLETG